VYVHPITKVIVAIWMDDLMIAGKGMKDIYELKAQLRDEGIGDRNSTIIIVQRRTTHLLSSKDLSGL